MMLSTTHEDVAFRIRNANRIIDDMRMLCEKGKSLSAREVILHDKLQPYLGMLKACQIVLDTLTEYEENDLYPVLDRVGFRID